MGLAQDAPPIDNRLGPLGLPFEVDCCMFFNILLIKSPSRETGGRSDARTAMTYLFEAPLEFSSRHDRSKH